METVPYDENDWAHNEQQLEPPDDMLWQSFSTCCDWFISYSDCKFVCNNCGKETDSEGTVLTPEQTEEAGRIRRKMNCMSREERKYHFARAVYLISDSP